MRRIILSLIAMFSVQLSFAQQESIEALMGQAISLHDKGDYSEAIAIYDKIIEQDRKNYTAYEEKSLSLHAAGKNEECVDWCKLTLKRFKRSEILAGLYINYGNSLDVLKKPEEAIKVYQMGIDDYPNIYLLHFNKGVTAYGVKKYETAIEDFKHSLDIRATHPASNIYLGYSIYTENKVAAIMAFAMALIAEPQGDRAGRTLNSLNSLLATDVKKEENDSGNITINITAPTVIAGRGEDDFHSAEIAISLYGALDFTDQHKELSAAEKLMKKLEMLPEGTDKSAKGFFTRHYVPFFTAMREEKHLEAACHIMLASTDDPTNNSWLKDNKPAIEKFYQWVNKYDWKN
ncbi:tetratricopeptide repeat protein [Chitinophaga agri]|uniref:Uncharacterized protein n=1 Tax=Chitinophaga agri TaxID=2703787 RepID=A0A6B9ZGJ8_9BACT|nr:tetratricopeptide repeat protein [Chitinophaga agri]QHS60444.1 hypothetical protein GWR21_12825 [Chitinophaga agri]